MSERPSSYEAVIDAAMANQDPANPVFQNRRECREWIDATYPMLRENFDALARMAGHVEKVELREVE